MHTFSIRTPGREAMVDITQEVAKVVSQFPKENGLCTVFVSHTTAGVTINENADPDVRRDMLMTLRHIVPDNLDYRHAEGNSTAHVKTSLMGSSVQVIVNRKQLMLGTWQSIFLCEFDGPRTRKVWVTFTQ